MKCVEAPDTYELSSLEKAIFLAGGITGCPDWQADVVNLLDNKSGLLFNPRRKNFPINDPTASEFQIKWEHDYLRKANAILFWFPCDTLCPIVLYELGAWSMTDKPIFVGVHPEYQRRKDVELQTKFARPGVKVVHSIQDLVAQVLYGV